MLDDISTRFGLCCFTAILILGAAVTLAG